MAYHISSKDTAPPVPKASESRETIEDYERRISVLQWMNSLSDEKTFRLELLQSNERIADAMREGFDNLIKKLEEITGK